MSSDEASTDKRPEINLAGAALDGTQRSYRGSGIFKSVSSLFKNNPETHPLAVQESLKLSFLATLIIGSCCIYAFRNAGVWNIGVCLCVMGIYWWYASKRTNTNVAKSVFADSFYYLGFLFTFVALIVTMIGLDTETGNFNAKAIIGQIGPALATTVVGMAVRIYITQFDAITSEPETEIFTGLGELSSNLSSAIAALQSMIGEHLTASEKQQHANLQLTQKFTTQLERLDFQPAVTALQTLGSEINTLTTQVDLLSRATGQVEMSVADLTSATYRTTTQLNSANEEFSRFRDIGEDFDKARESLTLVAEGARTLTTNIDSAAAINIAQVIADLDAKASRIGEKLNRTDNQITRLDESAGDAKEALSLSLAKLSDASTAVTGITDQMTKLVDLSDDLLEAKEAVQGLSIEVKEINRQISEEIENARGELGRTTELTTEILRGQVAPITSAIDQLAASLVPLQNNLRDLDTRVRRSVSDVLDFLNQTDAR